MALSTIVLRYNGSANEFPLYIQLGPRQILSKIFKKSDRDLDVTNLAALGELNRNAELQELIDAGTFSVITTKGHDDIDGAVPVSAAASGLSPMQILRVSMAVGGAAGTADDVTIYSSNAPFAFRIVDAFVVLSDAEGASSATLRSAAAGAGNALCNAIATATAGLNRAAGTAVTATGTVAAGGSLFLRRSDRNIAGELFILIQRT